ncbi:MAG: hypothetical protein AAF035_04305 [Pseudomonadota bacterium]
MSIHHSYAHFLANSTAVVSADEPQPIRRTEHWLNRLGLEIETRPYRLFGIALVTMLFASAAIAWFGYEVLSPALGGEWGARLAGVGLGVALGIPSLLIAFYKAR